MNPIATSRYRQRLSTSGAKSDAGDARVPSDIARLDGHNHRPIAGDSELAEAVKVLARAHQNLIWSRQRNTNKSLRRCGSSTPPALEAFDDVASGDALAVTTSIVARIERLETVLADRFEQHPDAKIIRSLPGLGTILGARALGEFGDDPNRYTDAKSRKNYAATSPITAA